MTRFELPDDFARRRAIPKRLPSISSTADRESCSRGFSKPTSIDLADFSRTTWAIVCCAFPCEVANSTRAFVKDFLREISVASYEFETQCKPHASFAMLYMTNRSRAFRKPVVRIEDVGVENGNGAPMPDRNRTQ